MQWNIVKLVKMTKLQESNIWTRKPAALRQSQKTGPGHRVYKTPGHVGEEDGKCENKFIVAVTVG